MSHLVKKIDPEISEHDYDKLLFKYFLPVFRTGYIELTEKKYCMPIYYIDFMEQIENFEVYDTDIFVLSHPKTGTTWLQEMVWMIGHSMEISKEYIFKRFPYLEVSTLHKQELINSEIFQEDFYKNSVAYTSKIKAPRYIKSHLPWELLPKQIRDGTKKPKLIYISRNPKDTCVSFFYHSFRWEGYTGDFDTFTELFLNGRTFYGPFPEHVIGYYKQKHLDNLLFMKYENMKTDLKKEIKRVASFLNKNLTEEQINQLQKHLSFESMRNNEAVNYEVIVSDSEHKFMRAGVIGSYKEVMSPEIMARFDKWTVDKFQDTGVSF